MDFARQARELLVTVRSNDEDVVGRILGAFDRLDRDAYVGRTVADIERALGSYGRRLGARVGELRGIRFYFAGAEVEPWIPSTCWANGYASFDWDGERFKGREVLFREGDAFELHLIDDLLYQPAQDGLLDDLDVFDELKEAFVYESCEIARRALATTCNGGTLAGAGLIAQLSFFAQLGHDEPTVLLRA